MTHPDTTRLVQIPGLGSVAEDSGFIALQESSDGVHKVGKDGVAAIYSTGDRKVEFICHGDRTLAYVKSDMGYPAYYPVHATELRKPVKAAYLTDMNETRREKIAVTKAGVLQIDVGSNKIVTVELEG